MADIDMSLTDDERIDLLTLKVPFSTFNEDINVDRYISFEEGGESSELDYTKAILSLTRSALEMISESGDYVTPFIIRVTYIDEVKRFAYVLCSNPLEMGKYFEEYEEEDENENFCDDNPLDILEDDPEITLEGKE